MCYSILFRYLGIPPPIHYWFQAPSVNQTCPFLSWLGQFLPPPVGITVWYLLKVRGGVTCSFIIPKLLSALSSFAQIWLCAIFRFLRSGLNRRYAAISAADSTTIPSVGKSKSNFSTFAGVVLIIPMIIEYAAFCRCSSLDLAKAMFITSHYATTAYVILGVIMCF